VTYTGCAPSSHADVDATVIATAKLNVPLSLAHPLHGLDTLSWTETPHVMPDFQLDRSNGISWRRHCPPFSPTLEATSNHTNVSRGCAVGKLGPMCSRVLREQHGLCVAERGAARHDPKRESRLREPAHHARHEVRRIDADELSIR
jgi:hypothetical protein